MRYASVIRMSLCFFGGAERGGGQGIKNAPQESACRAKENSDECPAGSGPEHAVEDLRTRAGRDSVLRPFRRGLHSAPAGTARGRE